GVLRVGGGSDTPRDSSAPTPITPYVLNACATTLRRNCSNSVARTRRPGERLSRSVSRTVNREAQTSEIGLHSHLNWILSKSSRLRNGPTHRYRGWIVCTGVGARAVTSPTAKTVTDLSVIRRRGCDRNSRST